MKDTGLLIDKHTKFLAASADDNVEEDRETGLLEMKNSLHTNRCRSRKQMKSQLHFFKDWRGLISYMES